MDKMSECVCVYTVYNVCVSEFTLLLYIPLLTTSRQLFQGHERLLLQHIQDIVLGTGGIWTWQGLINNREIFRMSMTQGCSKGATWAAAANEFLAPARQGSRFNTFSLTVNYTHTHTHTYHVIQTDAPTLEKNLTREAVHKGKPDLQIRREKCVYITIRL